VHIGEGFHGGGANAAHVNLIFGTKAEIGAPLAMAAASPGAGHIPFLAVLKPNTPVKPATLFVAKAVLRDENHETMTWGPAQAGVAAGVTEALLGGVLPQGADEEWLAMLAAPLGVDGEGWINLPEAPGFGVELDEDRLAATRI